MANGYSCNHIEEGPSDYTSWMNWAAEKSKTHRQTRCQRCGLYKIWIKKGHMMEEKESLLQFFAYEHLPANLQLISKPFGILAEALVKNLPRNPERTVALRKLLESKDCAVRALIFK